MKEASMMTELTIILVTCWILIRIIAFKNRAIIDTTIKKLYMCYLSHNQRDLHEELREEVVLIEVGGKL